MVREVVLQMSRRLKGVVEMTSGLRGGPAEREGMATQDWMRVLFGPTNRKKGKKRGRRRKRRGMGTVRDER